MNVKTSLPQIDASTKAQLKTIVAAIDQVKGQDTVVLDVRRFLIPTSFMVITSVDTPRQMRAIRDEIGQRLSDVPFMEEGKDSQQWLVVDYGSVIVHIMSEQARAFYELDELWEGAEVALE